MNYEKQISAEFALNEKISNVILIFLLFVRMVGGDLAIWIFGPSLPAWLPYWYNSVAYILTASIVWLNRHRLAALNIDRPFMVVLILGGIFYVLHPTPNNVGVLVGIVAGLILWAYFNNHFVFKSPVPYPKGTGWLILLTVPLALIPVLFIHSILKTPLSFEIFLETFIGGLMSYLALNVFEEVVFRGALWAYLRGLGVNERTAFYLQAFLFWIAHHWALLTKSWYSFFVVIPCITILLGLLAWRSKSLAPSTAAHFLFNFITQLLLRVYY